MLANQIEVDEIFILGIFILTWSTWHTHRVSKEQNSSPVIFNSPGNLAGSTNIYSAPSVISEISFHKTFTVTCVFNRITEQTKSNEF